jgi:CBS domain containing-hemolysin-like protein
VPESKPAVATFHAFRTRRCSIAVVVDEYGGVTGLVTTEDLLECVFGEIRSPSDVVREAAFEMLADGRARVDAAMNIDRFNQLFDAALEANAATTLAGVVLDAFGEMPSEGTSVEIGGWKLLVVAVKGARIESLIVSRRPAPTEPSATSEPGANDKPPPSTGDVDTGGQR